VEQEDFSEAIERVVAGLEKKSRVLNDKEKENRGLPRSWPCSGWGSHARYRPGGENFYRARGMAALGYTLQLPTEDRFLRDEGELKGQIATLLGGRALPRSSSLAALPLGLLTTCSGQRTWPSKW
jgi:cell division protease FtsH